MPDFANELRRALTEDPYLSSMFDSYTRLSGEVAGKRVLDYGCGYGWGSYELARAGALSVLGYDCDSQRVQTARQWFRHGNLNFSSDWDQVCTQRFDIVSIFFVISGDSDSLRIARELRSLPGDNKIMVFAAKDIYTREIDSLMNALSLPQGALRFNTSRPLGNTERVMETTAIF